MGDLIERIKKHEGFVSHGYHDSLGNLTIGYGRLIDQKKKGGISKEEAEILLRHDINQAEDAANQFTWYRKLDRKRQEVIIELIFNMGLPNLLTFKKMIKALKEDDFQEAAYQLLDSKWHDQVGSNRANNLADIIAGK